MLLCLNFIGLVQMSCGNDTTLNITIPVITISKSGGEELKKSMANGGKGNTFLYALVRIILSRYFRVMLLSSLICFHHLFSSTFIYFF